MDRLVLDRRYDSRSNRSHAVPTASRLHRVVSVLAAAFLAIASGGGVALADHPKECPVLPGLAEFTVGDRVTIGDRTFKLVVVEEFIENFDVTERFPVEEEEQHGEGEHHEGEGEHHEGEHHDDASMAAESPRPNALRLELLAQPIDAGRTEPRWGSYLTGLDVGFRALDGTFEMARGPLEFRHSEFGPSFGAVVPIDPVMQEQGGELTFQLSLSESATQPASDSSTDSGGEEEGGEVSGGEHTGEKLECPPLPLPDELIVKYGLFGYESSMETPEGNVAFDGEDVRLTLLSTIDPQPTESYSDIWGYSDGVTYVAIIGHANGTTFVDVTDPATPNVLTTIAGPNSSWRDFKTFGNYVYGVTEGTGAGTGMQVIDMTDPLTPTLVNTYTATFTSAHNIYIDTDLGHAYAVGTDFGTRILDVATDPVNPVEIGSWQTRYVHDAYVKNGRAYFAEINNGLHEILDVQNLGAISVLSSWATPDAAAHNSWANDDGSLVVTTDEVTGGHVAVYDTSDLGVTPPLVSEYIPNPGAIVHNAYFDDEDDEVVAISHYALGIHVIDLHRPTVPVLLGAYDTRPSTDIGGSGAWGVYPFEDRGLIYVSDIQTGLYVLRYDATGGTASGVVRDASNMAPVAGAEVVLLSTGDAFTTSADGVYALYAPEGDVELRIDAPGFATEIVNAGQIALGARLDADVPLTRLPSGPFAGTVRRSDTLAGIEGASVSIPELGLDVVTASDGTFDLGSVAIGSHVVTAQAFGFSAAELRVAQSTSGMAGVTIDLDPGAFVDDAETDQGWALGIPGDGASKSGEWERVDPVGTGGGNVQPEDDATPAPGATAFITGQASQSSTTEQTDVDGGTTTLRSPVFDASGLGAAKLGLDRWLSTAAGTFSGGGMLAIELSDDGGTNWTTLESTGANAPSWVRREFDVGSFVALTGQMQLRVLGTSAGSFDDLRVLEAGIDDVEVVAACRARFNGSAGDADFDGRVDACDPCPNDPGDDVDGDGACGDADNAPFDSNAGQADGDGDGIGDVVDNCVSISNVSQWDTDGDGLGNACDDDIDADGLPNGSDTDRDGDGEADGVDGCPDVPDARQLDADLDGTGDACDLDDGRVFGVSVAGNDVTWIAETSAANGYNVYRGDLGSAALLPLAGCLAREIGTEFHVDPARPKPGDAYFYLVSSVGAGGEATLGDDSAGVPRVIDAPCN